MANIQGTSGNDDIDGTAGDDNVRAGAGDDVVNGGDGNDTLRGEAGDDTLYGDGGNDVLQGGEGNDAMYGGVGNDTYFIDSEGDSANETAGGGIDNVSVSLQNYTMDANIEVLRMGGITTTHASGFQNAKGNELDNNMQGNASANNMFGDDGNDSIGGYGGDDIIMGGQGNDTLAGHDGFDIVSYKIGSTSGVTVDLSITGAQNTGGAGTDRISGFESLEGSSFNDNLFGTSNADKITGIAGNDFIRGRGGNDDLIGGADSDSFQFEAAAANGIDNIRGFASGTDRLLFNSSDGYDPDAEFVAGNDPAPTGSGAVFLFDTDRQVLSYDDDGNGAGAAIQIAYLPGATLTGSDIFINGNPLDPGLPTT